MIRRLVALAAALLLASCGAEPEGEAPSPALWEVTDEDGHTGWLFGTVHALPDGLEWQTPLLLSTLDKTGVLVVEVSDIGASEMAQQAFLALAASRDLPPLLSRVPPADRPALADALERAGMEEADFASTESWAAALIIANAERTGEVANGVDRALLARGLPVMSLESFGEQFGIFDALAPVDQQVLLAETAEDADGADERAMVEAWAAGDLAALRKEIDTGLLSDPELREALLVGRNHAWADEVVPLFSRDSRPFIAVGAGHLLGPEGLPELLKARGFTVKRLQ